MSRKGGRRIADRRRLDHVEPVDPPAPRRGFDDAGVDRRVEHRPRAAGVRTAEPQVRLDERPVARRLEQELEGVPGRPLDRGPRGRVPAQQRQEPLAAERLRLDRRVAANRQPAVVDDHAAARLREPAAELIRQSPSRRLPVERAQAGQQRVVDAPLHDRQGCLGLGDVSDELLGNGNQTGRGLRRLQAGRDAERQPSGDH